jgi:signal transduction histidine kinase/DNA-binding response OmpR family regulator
MMEQGELISILIVDDRPDKLVAMESIVSQLNQNIVKATSGKDALRCLLNQDFAVILLDVNMPGMDGFETAELIRQRKRSESTPIIFVTSYDDNDLHISRGYSLGAVDYIHTPVVPEVLRAKVSVFVELYRKTMLLKLQTESLRQRNDHLHKLTEASLAINSALSIDNLLQLIADTARGIIGAEEGGASTTVSHNWIGATNAVSPAKASLRDDQQRKNERVGIYSMVCSANRPICLTGKEWAQNPNRIRPAGPLNEREEVHGWVGAPLTARDGLNIGVVYLCRKSDGEFTADDEAILVQLAQMASVAIENTVNYEAREANKIKDEFLATLSHELRTPLTSMLAWTRMLRSGKLDGSAVGRGLEVIERNVKTQTKLIDDLLDVSRIISGKLRLNIRAVDLAPLIGMVVDALRPMADARGVELVSNIGQSSTKILGDADRLHQLVTNLVSNALKFTPKGGRVETRMECSHSHVEIKVIDNGRGISAEFLPHVFDRFRQADSSSTRAEGGLGLGLAIVQHLVSLHGGVVRAESAGIGKGALFTVMLPVVAAPADSDAASPPSVAKSRLDVNSVINLNGLRVLVVDDELDSREAMAEVLLGCGAEATCAESVTAALEKLDSVRPELIISDIGMPGQDGFELIRHVRLQLPMDLRDTPAIALTAYARDEDRVRALAAGFQMHLPKPIEPAELISAVASLCGRGGRLLNAAHS